MATKTTLNIGGHEDDPFFRYKMPQIQTKVEGQGKMIKTIISNIDQLSNSLKRPQDVILKYLGFSRNVACNLKLNFISGSHSIQDLGKQLSNFVDTFVLCANCGLPEANIVVTPKKLMLRCGSCGHNGPVTFGQADTAGSKTYDYIVKTQAHKATAKETALSKSGKRDQKKKGKRRDKDVDENEDEEKAIESCTSNAAANSSAAGIPPVPHSSKSNEAPPVSDVNSVCGIQISSVTATGFMAASEMADQALLEAARQADETAEQDDGDAGDDMDTAVESLRKYIGAHTGETASIISELRSIQIVNAFNAEERLTVLVRALCDGNVLVQLIEPNTLALLKQAFTTPASQTTFLHIIGQLTVLFPSVLAQVPHILKELYDNDILDEEVALAWDAELPSSPLVSADQQKLVQTHARPFIEWLRNAEEEEDEDDDD